MNAQTDSEQLQNFNQRLSQWVSSQGFWIQLRYTLSGAGGSATMLFHLMQLSVRALLFLLLLAGCFFIFLFKQNGSESFQNDTRASLLEKLGGEEIQIKGLTSEFGELLINRLAVTGKEGTFFTELELSNLKCKRGLLSRFQKEWDPGLVTISNMNLGLRAGADSPEAAESMANVYFEETGKLKLEKILVNEMSISWGYSESTRGAIIGSTMTADRLPDGWKLRFKGGNFSQNWLKRLDIEEMVVQFGRKGLVIEKAIFKKGEGFVTLQNLKVKAGVKPEVSGKVSMRKIDLSALLPIAAHNYLEGVISAELEIFGSTNSTEGIGFKGNSVIEDEDFITIRDRIHVLRAINVIDPSNNYRRIEFRQGGFHIKTQAGKLEITDANFTSGDLFEMKGSLIALPATRQEFISSNESISETDDLSILNEEETNSKIKLTLKGAAKQADAEKRKNFTQKADDSHFDQLSLSLEQRKMEETIAEELADAMRYEGEWVLSLPENVFAKSPKLEGIYPHRDAAGRVLMRVPLDGVIQDITLEQAESIYENGSR